MNSQHTPGPWADCFGGDINGFRCAVVADYDGARHPHVATIETPTQIDPDAPCEAAANARLIAAAPDMVAALIRMYESGKDGGAHEDEWHMCLLSETISKALGPNWQNAALSRQEGA